MLWSGFKSRGRLTFQLLAPGPLCFQGRQMNQVRRAHWLPLHAFSAKPGLLCWLAFVGLSCAVLRAHGTYHEMIEQLDLEMKQRPNDPTLIIRRAFIHLEHEDWKTALVDLERATRMGADEGDLQYLRGRALAAGGMLKQAREELDAYITNHREAGLALVERARVLKKLGEPEAALQDYRAALLAAPMPEPDLVIETAEALQAQKLNEEALSVLSRGIEKIGPVPQLVLKAMDYELTAQRYDDVLKRIDAMQACAPRPEPWMAKRASILAQAGRTDDAKAAWTKLRDHLLALSNLERGSHAMSRLLEEAQAALKSSPPQTITIISKS
jgi:tetratricopeptide (TPR) repeat protein